MVATFVTMYKRDETMRLKKKKKKQKYIKRNEKS